MAYIQYKGDKSHPYKGSVETSGHVATLTFDDAVVQSTSGFNVFIDADCTVLLGSYPNFRTIYRYDGTTIAAGYYQLSDDGSTWVDPTPKPVPPEPVPEPTLEEVKAQKIAEMNLIQQEQIKFGCDVTLSDGSVEHFTLTDHDQTSLMGLQTQVVAGVDKIPWHTADQSQPCKYYSNVDMNIITQTAMAYVTYHVTYFRDLRIYINSLETKEEVGTVYYGVMIPVEYQSEVLKDLIKALGIA